MQGDSDPGDVENFNITAIVQIRPMPGSKTRCRDKRRKYLVRGWPQDKTLRHDV